MRLQRFLAQAGVASRRSAEQLIAGGSVKVNGASVTAPGTVVGRDDKVEVDGRRVYPERPIYRLMLKPRACLATLKPTADRPTLARYLRDAEPGLQVVAPLDFPAEGLILLTNDGELAERVAKPRRGPGIPMTYHLKLQGKLTDEEITRLLRGWRWEGRLIRPQAIDALAATDKNMWLEMVVDETRPRALKAAGELIRHTLLKISRVRLGGLSFEGLPMGGWRDLTKVEVADLRRRAGLEA
ncbi:MAG TPA: S4 domain-containing protein [Polyangia bacterium]|jgi:23S rRNA pseudouridine2605 synthase|nr:S4 domain-containing protein [Polyangia bacterium]